MRRQTEPDGAEGKNRMISYIDTHAHIDDSAFDGDRDALLERLFAEGFRYIIDPAVDRAGSERLAELSARWPGLYFCAGIHPEEVCSAEPSDYARLETLTAKDSPFRSKVAAIGETGLDYHYGAETKQEQQENFRLNIRLALKNGLPLVIHDREAHQDTFDILREEGGFETGVLFHCYSGSAEFARELQKYGCYFSLGGAVTFKNARKFEEIVGSISKDRILPETDSPYMAPEPVRGRRNDPANLKYIYPRLAMLMGMDTEAAAEQFLANSERFFGIRI